MAVCQNIPNKKYRSQIISNLKDSSMLITIKLINTTIKFNSTEHLKAANIVPALFFNKI